MRTLKGFESVGSTLKVVTSEDGFTEISIDGETLCFEKEDILQLKEMLNKIDF